MSAVRLRPFMLRKETDMTVQSVDSLSAKSGETMPQPSQTKNGHISFSVASLLADTRPTKAESPAQSEPEDEYDDSNQEDSIVDVEDLNPEQKAEEPQFTQREFQQNHGPIRPTPFSALAAAVYSAATTHPAWGSQGLVGPFGPGPMFQGHGPFGVPNLAVGKSFKSNTTVKLLQILEFDI